MLTAFPTEAGAQDAEMSLAEYEHFVYGAGRLFEPDPVASWQGFAKHAFAAKAFLEGVRELRIVAEGTDLTLSVDGRTWEPSVGKENFPDGEVFTAPIETKVDGTIRFTYPAVFQGREVNDVELRFEGGEVVGSSASHGLEFLREMIGMDEGARRLGEFAFGLNDGIDRFTRNILFDEKIGGTVHLALGHVVSRDRRPQPLRPALGHHLRPPHGQRGLRRRRARLSQRNVPARRAVGPLDANACSCIMANTCSDACISWSQCRSSSGRRSPAPPMRPGRSGATSCSRTTRSGRSPSTGYSDPREGVWEIKQRNGLEGATIVPGQVLLLP